MANRWWGPADSVWSDDNLSTGNWYSDSGLTVRATKPGTADTAHFGTGAGDCTLDENPELTSIRFDLYSGYDATSTFDFDGRTLTFRGTARFQSSKDYTLTLPAGSILHYSGIDSSGSLYSKLDAVWPTIKASNPSGSVRAFSYNTYDFTVTNLILETSAAAWLEFRGASGSARIQGYSVGGTQHINVQNVPSSRAERMWWQTDFDCNDFEHIYGYMGFGYDRDVAITLPTVPDTNVGAGWYFENSGSGDVRISLLGTSQLYLTGSLDMNTRGTGDLTVDWSGASLTLQANNFHWVPQYNAGRDNDASRLILDFGDDNEFGVQDSFDFAHVSEFRGGTTTLNRFKLKGETRLDYVGPHRLTDPGVAPTAWQLPGSLDFAQATAVATTVYLQNNVDIAGDVTIAQTIQRLDAYLDLGTFVEQNEAVFRGGFIVTSTSGYVTHVHYNRPAIHHGDLDVNSASTALTLHFLAQTIDFYKDVQLKNNVVVDQAGGGLCRMHVPRKADRTLYIGPTGPPTFNGVWEICLDDATDYGLAHDFFLESIRASVVYFAELKIYNTIDAPMLALFEGHAADDKYGFGQLVIQGRGSVCSFPISDQYAVSCHSFPPGTFWRFSLTTASHPEFTKFQNAKNTGGVSTQPVYADNGTCFDEGGNVDITFDSTSASIAVCPTQAASFFAYRYGNLPATQSFQITNLGIGDLPEPTASGLPAWLDASFVDNGDGTWTMVVQPNDTDFAAGTYTDAFDINVAAARRSPQVFSITYDVSEDIVPIPDVDPVSFYQLRAQTFPAAQAIGVDNSYPAGGTLQQIVVTDLPAWLDVAYTVPGPADHQEFELTVNATGLALAAGTYSADITIDAPNAAQPFVLTVTMIVDRILIDTDRDQLDFSMHRGGTLPYESTFNVSNSGTAGTLAGVTATPSEAWLDAAVLGSGDGNNQNILVEINAGAQALAAGTYTAQVSVGSTNADNVPYTVGVELVVVTPALFVLTPTTVDFTPGRAWETPAAQQVIVSSTGEGPFAAPVTVTDAPAWLQVTVDASDPDRQIITLTPLEIPTDLDDFAVTLTVTGSYSLPLPVSMVVPAFFRRPDCQMDFIPRIEGTIIEECTVPAPPAPAPPMPPLMPPQPAPTYPKDITMTGPPCIECIAWVEYEDEEEVGYGKPHFYIECDDHGCDGVNLSSGTYGSGDNTPGGHPGFKDRHVTALVIDECGHICAIYFDDDDGAST